MVCQPIPLRGSAGFTTAHRDEDFAKFNNRENDIKLMQTQHKQMEMRLESMEKTQEGLEETTRYESAKPFPCSEKLNDS